MLICLYKPRWAVIVMLAITKAGRAPVPLDSFFSRERLKGIAEEAAPPGTSMSSRF